MNAGHQVIANSAEILGIATVSEAMLHGDIRALFLKVTMQEIAPHVPHVPETSPIQYIDLVERRFSNPAIVDSHKACFLRWVLSASWICLAICAGRACEGGAG